MKPVLAGRTASRPLLWLVALLLCLSVLPHVWNLPAPIPAAFFLFMTLRLLIWPRPETIPSGWVRVPLVILGLGLVIQQAGLTEGRQFGVALLVIMAGLKLLELTTRRDLMVAVFLGYFLLVTLFLFSQSVLLTGHVLLLTIAYTTVLVLANRSDDRLALRPALSTALGLGLGGIPVMVLLFVLFPRLEGPLWSLNLGGGSGITGMSDKLSMGSIASLSQSDEVAFRVRFQGEIPPPGQRYWRGLVLWHTDGRHWTRVSAEPRRELPPAADALAYEVTMEPSDQPWLFPLDRVMSAEPGLRLDEDDQLGAAKPVVRRFTWRGRSRLPPVREPLTRRARTLGLQLPPKVTPRTRRLALEWRGRGRDDREVVESALHYFNREPFVYTLQPPRLGDQPVDQFLFETRKGFCEHYAASFVLLMRLAGIPARVVVGYLGGERNPVGDHLVVRQSDAHAWAEVWLAGSGWTRVDPTAAVAPQRIEQGVNPLPAPEGSPARFRLEVPAGALSRLARALGWYRDNLQLMWHYWVIGYDLSRQQDLLQKFGLEKLRGHRLGVAAVLGALGTAALLFLLFGLRPDRREDPARRAWHRFRSKLRRGGLKLSPATGPLETEHLAMQRFPRQARIIQRIVHRYIELRYAPAPHAAALHSLKREIRRLRL